MIKAERHKLILDLLNGDGVVIVGDLASRCDTSHLTIRRDLINLENQGLLSRTHGGAVIDDGLKAYAQYEGGTFEDRESTHKITKWRIGEQAAKFVPNGASLIMNGGSTITAFARALRFHENLQVITNGLTVAMELARNPSASIYVLPGSLDKKKMTTIQLASIAMPDVWGHSLFLGVTGINLTAGPMISTPEEAGIYRSFIDAASEVNILADSSKFHSAAMFRIAPLTRVTRIVTDSGIGEHTADRLRKLGIEMTIVDSRGE